MYKNTYKYIYMYIYMGPSSLQCSGLKQFLPKSLPSPQIQKLHHQHQPFLFFSTFIFLTSLFSVLIININKSDQKYTE